MVWDNEKLIKLKIIFPMLDSSIVPDTATKFYNGSDYENKSKRFEYRSGLIENDYPVLKLKNNGRRNPIKTRIPTAYL